MKITWIPYDRYQYTGVKLGAVVIGIGKGIGVGLVEIILHITIAAISFGMGIGIAVGQRKHTISNNEDAYHLHIDHSSCMLGGGGGGRSMTFPCWRGRCCPGEGVVWGGGRCCPGGGVCCPGGGGGQPSTAINVMVATQNLKLYHRNLMVYLRIKKKQISSLECWPKPWEMWNVFTQVIYST